jgi:2-keto-3-deoxy-L-rhamnonate aldolase RhmA
MRENTLKQRLYAGKAAFGVMCTFPSPPVVEMLGHLGFDWILLDNEHGSITVDTAEACIAVAELTGTAPIVRPVGNKPEIIARFGQRGTMTLTNLIACYAVLAYNMNTYELEAPAHPTEKALPAS